MPLVCLLSLPSHLCFLLHVRGVFVAVSLLFQVYICCLAAGGSDRAGVGQISGRIGGSWGPEKHENVRGPSRNRPGPEPPPTDPGSKLPGSIENYSGHINHIIRGPSGPAGPTWWP